MRHRPISLLRSCRLSSSKLSRTAVGRKGLGAEGHSGRSPRVWLRFAKSTGERAHHAPTQPLARLLAQLPAFDGPSVTVSFLPALTAGSQKLYSDKKYGQPVHAATFIRKRRIVLDQELERRPRELARILTHELFHFVWVRLSNQSRRSYEVLIRQEWRQHAGGELGWSAESRKILSLPAKVGNRRRRWREYLCESFCDTAAWLFSGVRRHPEFTLAARYRKKRAAWFAVTFRSDPIPI